MPNFHVSDLTALLFSLGALLLLVRMFSHISSRLHVPSVVGEIVLGILIGPTVLGTFNPQLSHWLFPLDGNTGTIIQGLISIAVILLVFVAGLETNLAEMKQEGKKVICTGIGSMILPFFMGFAAVMVFPTMFHFDATQQILFASFIGIAMAISALPVIIRILMDLRLYHTRVGIITVASATMIDLVGWVAFAAILGCLHTSQAGNTPIWMSMLIIVSVVVGILTLGQHFFNHFVDNLQARCPSPEKMLAIGIGCGLLGAATTELLGIHATLGAFLIGVVLGNAPAFPHQVKSTLRDFVTHVISPLFFIGIGVKTNFITNLDASLLAFVLAISIISKVSGTFIGGRLGGLKTKEALAVGFALNARGAMEILLAKQALDAGLIDPTLFVALVLMAVLTSLLSAPALRFLTAYKSKASPPTMVLQPHSLQLADCASN